MFFCVQESLENWQKMWMGMSLFIDIIFSSSYCSHEEIYEFCLMIGKSTPPGEHMAMPLYYTGLNRRVKCG